MSDVYQQAGHRGGESRPKVDFPQPGAWHDLNVQQPRMFTFSGDDNPTLIVDVTDDAGNELSLICGPIGLHNAVVEAAAPPGSRIRVIRGDNVALPNGNTAHNYTCEVLGAPGQPAVQQPVQPVAPPPPAQAPFPNPAVPQPAAAPAQQYQQPAPPPVQPVAPQPVPQYPAQPQAPAQPLV